MGATKILSTPSCLFRLAGSRVSISCALRPAQRTTYQSKTTSVRTINTTTPDRSAILSQCRLQVSASKTTASTPSKSLVQSRQFTNSAVRAQQPTSPQQQLTWNDFLQLRKTRRYISLVSSIATGLGSIAVTVPIMAQYEVENQIAALTGLDPFIAIGLTITAVGGIGWLLGPFVGNAAFGLWKRNLRGEITRREKDFYAHIKRYRADPTSSSVNNPVPDYYGEKIGSVADYRRWLKDQRAFTRKKNKNLI